MNISRIVTTPLYYSRWIKRSILCRIRNVMPCRIDGNLIDHHREQSEQWNCISTAATEGFESPHFENRAQKLLDFLDFFPGTCLEIGCSNGWFGKMLVERDKNVDYVGVDFRKETLHVTKNKNAHFVAADGVRLPFNDHCFNTLLVFHVIEHIRDIPRFTKEIRRVMHHDAIAVFCVPLGYDTDPCHR